MAAQRLRILKTQHPIPDVRTVRPARHGELLRPPQPIDDRDPGAAADEQRVHHPGGQSLRQAAARRGRRGCRGADRSGIPTRASRPPTEFERRNHLRSSAPVPGAWTIFVRRSSVSTNSYTGNEQHFLFPARTARQARRRHRRVSVRRPDAAARSAGRRPLSARQQGAAFRSQGESGHFHLLLRRCQPGGHVRSEAPALEAPGRDDDGGRGGECRRRALRAE